MINQHIIFKSENKKPIISYNDFNCLLGLIRKIKDGSIDLENVRENQKEFRSNLSETARQKWEHKSEDKKSTLNNLKMFYKAREKVINFSNDYTARLSMKQNMEKDSKYQL